MEMFVLTAGFILWEDVSLKENTMPKRIDPAKQEAFISVRLPTDLRARLEAVAVAEDRSASTTARRAIEAYVLAAEAARG